MITNRLKISRLQFIVDSIINIQWLTLRRVQSLELTTPPLKWPECRRLGFIHKDAARLQSTTRCAKCSLKNNDEKCAVFHRHFHPDFIRSNRSESAQTELVLIWSNVAVSGDGEGSSAELMEWLAVDCMCKAIGVRMMFHEKVGTTWKPNWWTVNKQ